MSEKKRILILSANPKTTTRLRLDEEVRRIEEALQFASNRNEFEVKQLSAVRFKDIRRGLLRHKPHIVHFTGHGKRTGILVEDDNGYCESISVKVLSELFELLTDIVDCVILNACHSARQAKVIGKYINYVIGIRKEIKDTAAIEFSVGLYDAIGAGWPMEDAFKLGRNAILQKFPDGSQHTIPIFINKNVSKNKNVTKPTASPTDKPFILAIRSFVHPSHDDIIKQADALLCLCHHFQGRKLVNGTWEDIIQEIKEFIFRNIKAGNRYDLFLPLHTSLAFLVGRTIDPKCGAEINISQPSPSKALELWRLKQFDTFIDDNMWTIEVSTQKNIGSELAAALSVTLPTLADVDTYIKDRPTNISHLLHLELGKPNPRAIQDVSQAYAAAYKAVLILRDKYRQVKASKLHLFLAAPNVFTFMLGQQSLLLKNITLYEYDFDSKEPGAYTPSLTL